MQSAKQNSGDSLLTPFIDNLHSLVPHNLCKGSWAIAFSGGPDSMALAVLMKQAIEDERGKKVAPSKVFLIHVNHGLRGIDSDNDQLFAENAAHELGFDILCRRLFPPKIMHGSMEAWARKERYEALSLLCEQAGALALLTGHHKNDNAETVVQRLMRGAGLKGLAGIPRIRNLDQRSNIKILRPLLPFTRREISGWLASQGHDSVLDKSNLDNSIKRNWIRNRLIPALDGTIAGTGVTDELCLIAEEAKILNSLLNHAAEKAMKSMLSFKNNAESWFTPFHLTGFGHLNEAVLKRDLVERLPKFLLYPLLMKVIEKLDPFQMASISKKAFDAAAQKIENCDTGAAHLGSEFEMLLFENRIKIRKTEKQAPAPLKPIMLSTPGEANLPDESAISAKITENRIEAEGIMNGSNPFTEALDCDRVFTRVNMQLVLRQRKPGDRHHPLGAKGKKKLKDILINIKAPKSIRDYLLCVCNEEGIIWIPGLRIGHPYRIRSDTKRFLILKIFPT